MTHFHPLIRGPSRRRLLAVLAALPLAACAGGTAQAPLTFARSATDPDPLAAFRLFADADGDDWARHLGAPTSAVGPTVLAISGGGEDGAFGAGGLAGWSTRGDRPDFDVVTGVSTGALIAPFAFLGPDYDDTLRQIFTEHDAGDIMRLHPSGALFGDALYDTAPLEELIETYTPDAVLLAIATRHAAGARLLVVTSELDTARASVWNMGVIAQSGDYALFRAVLRASAALPGFFSPVEISYLSNGVARTETHMDGGVHMQFLAIPAFAFTESDQQLLGGKLYVLVNNTLDPAPITAARSALGISQQALTTTGRASAVAAVSATQLFAHETGLDLSVTSIDPASGIVYDPSDRFSSVYMNALFHHGRDRAIHDTLWQSY